MVAQATTFFCHGWRSHDNPGRPRNHGSPYRAPPVYRRSRQRLHSLWVLTPNGRKHPWRGLAGSGPPVDQHGVLAVDLLQVGEVEPGLVEVALQELSDAV